MGQGRQERDNTPCRVKNELILNLRKERRVLWETGSSAGSQPEFALPLVVSHVVILVAATGHYNWYQIQYPWCAPARFLVVFFPVPNRIRHSGDSDLRSRVLYRSRRPLPSAG